MSSSLELSNITRVFGQNEVLRNVSLTVPASTCTALLGASGSGKSTLLRVAAGLEVPSAGKVLVDGANVDGVPPERRGIALVFQKPLLFPHLNVVDNVAFSARMAGHSKRAARAEAREFLDLVHLEDFAGRAASKLSGGQEQRVSLARALAQNPRILLLDEPFSSLDSRLREDMYTLLEDIRSQLQPTIVLVTHDRREASVLADTIAVLDGGSILQHGPVAQLHYEPSSLAVNRILGGLNEIPGVVRGDCHHSVLGTVQLRTPTPEGPAHLVIRQEAVRIVGRGDGEAQGMLVGLKSLGAHTLVTVEITVSPRIGSPNASTATNGSVMISAEIAGTPTLKVGERVGVGIDQADTWLIPG